MSSGSRWPGSFRINKSKLDLLEKRLNDTERKLDVIFHYVLKKFGDVLPDRSNSSYVPVHKPCPPVQVFAGTSKIVRVSGDGDQTTTILSELGKSGVLKDEGDCQLPVLIGSLARKRKQTFEELPLAVADGRDSDVEEQKPDIEYEFELTDPLDINHSTSPESFGSLRRSNRISDKTDNVLLKVPKTQRRKPKKATPKIHKCPHPSCTEEFNTAKDMNLHRKTHRKPHPHKSVDKTIKISDPCTVCGKTITRRNMPSHMRTHSTKCDFKCEDCGKEFKLIQSWKIHRAMHLGIKKQCNICGLVVSVKALRRHVRYIHEKIRPYTCEKCGLGFKSPDALRYHLGTHDNPNSKRRGLNKDRVDFVRKSAKDMKVQGLRETVSDISKGPCETIELQREVTTEHTEMQLGRCTVVNLVHVGNEVQTSGVEDSETMQCNGMTPCQNYYRVLQN